MKKVYVGMAGEIIHEGHINLLMQASQLGEVTVGLLTDKAIAEYKTNSPIPYNSRKVVLESLRFVKSVVPQDSLDYSVNLKELTPNYVVHGDDWRFGVQSQTRAYVLELVKGWGGELVEIPYTQGVSSTILKRAASSSSFSGRGASLRRAIEQRNKPLRFIDLHSALSGLIAEHSFAKRASGEVVIFDGMWASSLTDSTSRGKPDIEAVDVSARLAGLQDTLDVTRKPIIFDGDTGGVAEHFAFTVKSLERNNISAVIIEDKKGLKKNSLLEQDSAFEQELPNVFAEKIKLGKSAQSEDHFMIIARIESLILGKKSSDALERAEKYLEAGADGIMFHSRDKNGEDWKETMKNFRKVNSETPVVVVPTSFPHVADVELWERGANVIIYANHLLRASYPSMLKAAREILLDGNAANLEKNILSMKEILNLIPGTA